MGIFPYDSLACDKLGSFCVFLLCISFRISCCEQIHHCFVLENKVDCQNVTNLNRSGL